jgi:hypothetical protein
MGREYSDNLFGIFIAKDAKEGLWLVNMLSEPMKVVLFQCGKVQHLKH